MSTTPTPSTPAAAPAHEEHEHGPNCNHDHHGHHHSVQPFVRATPKLGRNDPCACGSGKKFKKCCYAENA